MQEAFRHAKKAELAGEVPVGCVIVYQDEIIATGYNQPIQSHDPTAHAEIIAMREAAQKLQNYRLSQCSLYVTLEPCSMCVGAMILARIGRLVFGAREKKTGACGSMVHLLAEAKWNHRFKIHEGILEFESAALLQEFFKGKRKT